MAKVEYKKEFFDRDYGTLEAYRRVWKYARKYRFRLTVGIICGMLTAPGEIIHMDANGAVKFPRKYLKEVLENCKAHAAYDDKRQAHMKEYTDPIKVAEAMAGLYN